MKRISTLLLLVFSVFAASAQVPDKVTVQPQAIDAIPVSTVQPLAVGPTGGNQALGTQVIWSEDFGNGWPAGWTVDDVSGICPWVYTTDGSWGFFNGNNATAGGAGITSTTAANGFLICDPDSANHFTYGQPSGSNYQYLDSYFITESIDLSGYPSVKLEFEQFFRYNNTVDMEVQISNDSINWTTYLVQGNSANNVASSNPDLVSINISPVAGDESEVWIKIGWSARVYYWMIDDMRITTAPANDLLNSGVYWSGRQDSTRSVYYYQVPHRQAQQDSLWFAAIAENQGSATQQNVMLTVDVTGPISYTGTSNTLDSLQVLESDTLDVTGVGFKPGALGTYTVDFTISSDSVDAEPLDNTFSETFEVTDTTYARDNDNYVGNGIWYGGGNTYAAGNAYDIWTNDTITSVSVLFQGNTAVNSVVTINVYEINDLNTPIASNAFNSLTAAQIGSWVNFPLPETPIPPGYYVAAFETFSDSVLMAVAPDALPTPPLTTFVNVNAGGWGYATDFTPFIRLHTKEFTDPCTATLNATANDPTCNGANDGSINLTVNGGFGNLTYAWSNGATTQDLTGIGGGQYDVTVTSDLGCSYVSSIDVVEPTVLASSMNSTDENCGSGDGTATISLTGGSMPYAYVWENFNLSPTLTNLAAGTYTVSFTDANGCGGTDSVTVAGTPAILVNSVSLDAACGMSDGSGSVTPSTGTSPYTYAWDAAAGSQTTSTATGLAAGIYNVTITDNIGCSSEVAVNVSNTGAPSLSASTQDDVSCNGLSDGELMVAATGGATPYTYSWTNGSTTATASGLAAGTYTVIVTDASNCQQIQSYDINEPNAISALTSSTDAQCNGGSDGSASVSVFGGTAPYTYAWSSGGTASSETGLSSGTVFVTVTDANGCIETEAATVSQPSAVVGVMDIEDVTCFGGTNGQATVNVSGGSFPYTYAWGSGGTTDTESSLAAGNVSVTVTDNNGCVSTVNGTILEPSQLQTSGVVNDELADWTGQINLTVSGGTSGYSYQWSGEAGFTATTQDVAGLTQQGSYSVTVTDGNNCTATETFTVAGWVSVDEIFASADISIFPNPSNGQFVLELGNIEPGAYMVRVRNVVGQEVAVEQLSVAGNDRHLLNMSNLTSGVYFMTLTGAHGEVTRKLVIE